MEEDTRSVGTISGPLQQLCLLLACSRTTSLPAFIFFRPCFAQPRWTLTGDLSLQAPEGRLATFQGLIRKSITSLNTDSLDLSPFPASAIGCYDSVTEISAGLLREDLSHEMTPVPYPVFCLAEDLNSLLDSGYLDTSYQEGLLYFTLDERMKKELRDESTCDELHQATHKLVKLAASSLPDPYSEPLWELRSIHCRDLLITTVLPYLNSIEPNEFTLLNNVEQITVDDFQRVVIHSTYHGIWKADYKLSKFWKPTVLGWSRETRGFLLFQETLMAYLSSNELEFHIFADLDEFLGQPYTSALIGMALDSVLGLSTRFPDQTKVNQVAEWWRAHKHKTSSVVEIVADILLLQESSAYSYSSIGDFPRIIAAVGCGLARKKIYQLSISLLENSLVHSRNAFKLVEYGYLSAELVKCYNSFNQEEKGDAFGTQALQLLSISKIDLRTELAYLLLASADSVIGQGKYVKATQRLKVIIDAGHLSPHLLVTAALRMNKIGRRMSLSETSSLLPGSNLSTALCYIQEVEPILRLEYMTEIGATIVQLKQSGVASQENILENEEIQIFLQAALETFSNDNNLLKDWRLENIIVNTKQGTISSSQEKAPAPLVNVNPEQDGPPNTYETSLSRTSLLDILVPDQRESLGRSSISRPRAKSLPLGTHHPGVVTSEKHPQKAGHHLAPKADSTDIFESWEDKSLLTFDNGGVRSYASLLMLEALMKYIGELERTNPVPHQSSSSPFHTPMRGDIDEGSYTTAYFPCHYFDYIMGTSTGGLLSVMLSRLRLSVSECLLKFESMSSGLFGYPRRISLLGLPYDKHHKAPLISAARTLVESRTPPENSAARFQRFSSPADLCRTVVFATQESRNTSAVQARASVQDGPFMFKSYRVHEAKLESPSINNKAELRLDPEIWQVCRATMAAPTLFRPQIIESTRFYEDRSTENPTVSAWNEISSLHGERKFVVASFGTGRPSQASIPRRTGTNRLRIGNAMRLFNDVLRKTKSRLTEPDKVHIQVQETQNRERGGPSQFEYFRFNVEKGLGKIAMDETKTPTFATIRQYTREELSKPEVKNQLSKLAELLVEHRRARIRDDPDRWDRFACCTTYSCSEEECRTEPGEPLTFALRREMRDHLLVKHRWAQEPLEEEGSIFDSEGDPDVFESEGGSVFSKSEGKWKSYKPEKKGQESSKLQKKLDQCRKEPEVPGGPF